MKGPFDFLPTADWPWVIRTFGADGQVLLVTTHRTEASRDVELLVIRDRIAKGDVKYAELLALEVQKTTIYRLTV